MIEINITGRTVAEVMDELVRRQVGPAEARIVYEGCGTHQVTLQVDTPESDADVRKDLPNGLCADKADHDPHEVLSGSLAPYWCTADQQARLPYAAQGRQRG